MLKGWTVDVHAQNNLNFVCSNLNLGIWKFQRRSIFWSKNWPCLGMGKLQLPSDENIELYLQNVVFLAGQCPHWDRAQSDFGKHRVHSRWARWCKVATQDTKLPLKMQSCDSRCKVAISFRERMLPQGFSSRLQIESDASRIKIIKSFEDGRRVRILTHL